MTEPLPPRGPLSTIRGWMIAIAGIGAMMGVLALAPVTFIPVLIVLMETLAFRRFHELRRRGPMSARRRVGWVLIFLVAIPLVSTVAGAAALMAYCSMNPDAFNGL